MRVGIAVDSNFAGSFESDEQDELPVGCNRTLPCRTVDVDLRDVGKAMGPGRHSGVDASDTGGNLLRWSSRAMVANERLTVPGASRVERGCRQ